MTNWHRKDPRGVWRQRWGFGNKKKNRRKNKGAPGQSRLFENPFVGIERPESYERSAVIPPVKFFPRPEMEVRVSVNPIASFVSSGKIQIDPS